MSNFEVEAYAGYRGDERPKTLVIEGQRYPVTQVLREWQEPEGRYFKLRLSDGRECLVVQDTATGSWAAAKPR